MKLINKISKCTAWSACFIMILMLASGCSKTGDQRTELLKLVSDDAAVVGTVNLQAYLENAGGKIEDGQIVMPDFFDKLSKNFGKHDRKAYNTITSVKGLNLESVVFAVYSEDESDLDENFGSFMFCITDKDEFAAWAKDADFDEVKEGDLTCYSNDKENTCFAVDGSVAYLMFQDDSSDAADMLKQVKKSVDKKGLAQWKIDYLSADKKTFTLLTVMDKMPAKASREFDKVKELNEKARVFGMEQTIDGLHLQTMIKVFDNQGKPTDLVAAADYGVIDTNVLTYFPKDYNIFGAFSVNGKFFDQIKKEVAPEFNSSMIESFFGDNISNYTMPKYDYWGYYTYEYYNPLREQIDSISASPVFQKPSQQINAIAFGMGVKSGAKINFNHFERSLKDVSVRSVLQFANANSATDYYKAWKDLDMIGEVANDQVIEFSPYNVPLKTFMMRKGADVIMSNARTFETASHTFPCKLDEAIGFVSLNVPKNDPLIKALPVKVNFGVKAWILVTRNAATIDITMTDTEGTLIKNLLDLTNKIAAFDSSDYDYEYEEVDVYEPDSVEVVEEVAAYQ